MVVNSTTLSACRTVEFVTPFDDDDDEAINILGKSPAMIEIIEFFLTIHDSPPRFLLAVV